MNFTLYDQDEKCLQAIKVKCDQLVQFEKRRLYFQAVAYIHVLTVEFFSVRYI